MLGLFVALTITFASTTFYESGIRTTFTSTSTSTSTAISVETTTSTVTNVSTIVSTITTTSVFVPAEALKAAYLSHIGAIVSRNATELAAQYETNATLLVPCLYGPASCVQGVDGSFNGSANIARYYDGGPVLQLSNLAAANDTYSMTISNDGNAGNVTSHPVFYGNGTVPCCWPNFTGTGSFDIVEFNITYVLQGDRWLVSTETLTFISGGHCAQAALTSDGSVYTCLNYGSA